MANWIFPTNPLATEKLELDFNHNFAILHNKTSKNNAHSTLCEGPETLTKWKSENMTDLQTYVPGARDTFVSIISKVDKIRERNERRQIQLPSLPVSNQPIWTHFDFAINFSCSHFGISFPRWKSNIKTINHPQVKIDQYETYDCNGVN